MQEEKTKKRNSILKLIMDAFVLLLFSTTCCIQDMAIIPLVHISSKLNNLVKFYSIDLDLAAAGIDQGSMIEQFKKNPLAYRKPVERHKRNRFILLTPEHEKALDQQFVSQMKSMNILWNDPAALQRCNNILNKFAKTMPDHFTPPKEIYILDVPIANASCLPGGSIVIFRGLLYVANDDELAYIIAHELGHGAAHHTAETISKSMLQNLAIDKILDDNSSLLEIAGTHIAQFMINMRYSREQENEADRLALVFMNKAGFQLQGAVTMLEKFKNTADIFGEYYELLSSHPHPAKRLENVNRSIAQLNQNPDHIWETEDVIEKAQNKIEEKIPDIKKKVEEKAPVIQKKIEEKFPGLQEQVKEKAKEKLKGRFRF
jgi:predicted Zn-dependent protease